MVIRVCTFSFPLALFTATTDQEALPGSPISLPTSPQSHLVPPSPLVKKGDGPPSPLGPTFQSLTPSLRRRHGGEEDDHLQNKFRLELSPFDTSSVFSMPSMLSLHSHVEGVASRHEEQEVHTIKLLGGWIFLINFWMMQQGLGWSLFLNVYHTCWHKRYKIYIVKFLPLVGVGLHSAS